MRANTGVPGVKLRPSWPCGITFYIWSLTMPRVNSVDTPTYVVEKCSRVGLASYEDQMVIDRAIEILRRRIKRGPLITGGDDVTNYLQLEMGVLDHEVFKVLFLDSRHRLLADETMFRGTINQTSVYPREIVVRALHHGACAVILVHNHPSGLLEQSRADENLTQAVKAALALVDVRVLDHFIVTCEGYTSFAKKGLL